MTYEEIVLAYHGDGDHRPVWRREKFTEEDDRQCCSSRPWHSMSLETPNTLTGLPWQCPCGKYAYETDRYCYTCNRPSWSSE